MACPSFHSLGHMTPIANAQPPHRKRPNARSANPPLATNTSYATINTMQIAITAAITLPLMVIQHNNLLLRRRSEAESSTSLRELISLSAPATGKSEVLIPTHPLGQSIPYRRNIDGIQIGRASCRARV